MRLSWLAVLLLIAPAQAKWKPEYASVPKETRDWYESRVLTKAAEDRLHFHSCCNNADVVKTQFRVGGTGNDEWYFMNDAHQWQRVPDDIIHFDQFSPTGEPVMFAVGGTPVCFFPPQGGI